MGRRLWIVLASLLAAMSSANAGPHLFRDNEAPPLAGWVEFCNRTPDECVVDESQPEFSR